MLKNRRIIFGIIVIILILVLAVTFIIIKPNKKEIRNICVVQFETSGGSKIEAQEVEKGIKVTKPENPIKSGFTFIEWQLNGETFDFETLITENIIITAKWEANEGITTCIVSFDSDGGSEVNSIEVAQGSSMTAPNAPTKDGYIFKGWFLQEEKFDFANIILEDIILKAKWVKNNSKSENINNEYVDSSNGVITTDSNEISKNYNNDEIDNIVYDYAGTWYLQGYSDVYIKIKKVENLYGPSMEMFTTNFCSSTYEIYPLFKSETSCGGSFSINYESFKEDLELKGIQLASSGIRIEKNDERFIFVKTKGNKDKYDYFNTMYKESIGTWYLYNSPNSKIIIESIPTQDGDWNSDLYSISTTRFLLDTFATNGGGYYGAEKGVSDALFNKYGITINNETLTITNSYGTRVFYKTPTTIAVEGISLNNNKLSMYIGDKQKLSAFIQPTDAYNSNITWSSSNTKVATVDANGNVEALSSGTAIITVNTEDGNYVANCDVTVTAIEITGITIDKENLNMILNETQTISARIQPANATNKNIMWESSNTNIATVDSNGKVTATGVGNATITAKTEDGGFTASCNVTINTPPLRLDGSIGFSTRVSNNGVAIGMVVNAKPSGGTGDYTYNIKLYYEGNLIGEGTSDELFVNQSTNGTYSAIITVVDSNGETATVTKTIIKS